MRTSGKKKMGDGWVMLIDHPKYLAVYTHVLDFALTTR